MDFKTFIEYYNNHIKGDEKGESQIFLDRFFGALGYKDGLKGAGANCEFRVRDESKGSTKFADLVWKPKVLIEMKRRDSDLALHYQQAFDYWTKLVPNRPKYVILCNFDEFWIYDLNEQVYDPLEKIKTIELEERSEALGFLFPTPLKPIFNYNKEDITERAAKCISYVYNSIKKREKPEIALKYCLQIVLALFAEDINLLPNQIFSRIIQELDEETGHNLGTVPKSYDLIGGLFQAMNTEGITPGGKFSGVDYFNGGLFDHIYPIELTEWEIDQIKTATFYNWKHVNPAIFGSIFEAAMDDKERHKLGAHYTHEIDIKKIVVPVIVQPWLKRIENAQTLDEYYQLLDELSRFKVLDPACGSGNFLFIAYKEIKLLEKKLIITIRDKSKKREDNKRYVKFWTNYKFISTDLFYGIDIKPFAVELAKVTMMIAKELTWLEAQGRHDRQDKPLPLDNLDSNILCQDALINDDGSQRQWPDCDAIIGNPPYQSKNKMQKEFGIEYLNKIREAYPDIPGRADFCVYWFYKAHNHLKQGDFAGLVGTNTIRQNYSRVGSLDYIVKNGGTIVDAVSSEEWSGDAVVFVSIVCWKKGLSDDDKVLWYYDSDNVLHNFVSKTINSSLSLNIDVTSAKILKTNTLPKKVFQGQTHGHEGFLIPKKQALKFIENNTKNSQILKPFLIADELIGNIASQPSRFVIDFTLNDIIEASGYKCLYQIVEKTVLPDRKRKAKEQEEENFKALQNNPSAKVNKHHINFYNNWWQLSYSREDMLTSISKLKRYISCARVTKRPIFEFISSEIHPNDALMVFSFEDDYSFGIIGSLVHWLWFVEKCSTLKGDWRYTTESVWDTFPWPQAPNHKQIEDVASSAKNLRIARNDYLKKNNLTLRDLYKVIEKPGKNPLVDLQKILDKAVIDAYGFNYKEDILQQLLELNIEIFDKEQNNEQVQGPGIPNNFPNRTNLISEDCVTLIT
jgi:type II restriction/modification system DNA methylase subunit YeeA